MLSEIIEKERKGEEAGKKRFLMEDNPFDKNEKRQGQKRHLVNQCHYSCVLYHSFNPAFMALN